MRSPRRGWWRTRAAAVVTAAVAAVGLIASAPAQATPTTRAATANTASVTTKDKVTPTRPVTHGKSVYLPAGCTKQPAGADSRTRYATCDAYGSATTAGKLVVNADGPPSGALGPTQIQAAYDLPTTGQGQTVAIVDAGGYATAESDLAVFRSYYGLPACTSANGCFTKVDQNGGTNYPPEDGDWSIETALDLDAVSSACPNCRIVLVEGDSASLTDLAQAANTAATFHPAAISNSYGLPGEDAAELGLDSYYDHPGIAVTASTGDYGYLTEWPATSPDVVAVGGTTLTAAQGTGRGWTETAWSGAGSGCSPYEPKPAFQADANTGCADRAIADVSADADPASGLGIYNSTATGGWARYGGTSLASPLVAAMYALAGQPTPGTYPGSYPYTDPDRSADFNDVTAGSNGSCTTKQLCTAGPGWDGPTGIGSPHGVAGLTQGAHGAVAGTVTDAATGTGITGATIAAVDADGDRFTATTDSSGAYTLTVPVGTYDVTASMFGYGSKKTTGVAVTAGQTAAAAFALTAVASHTVSGTVTDGSGHGWPMYAKIQIDGYPNGAVYTNPYTGAYSVKLPDNGSYSLTITPVDMQGYTADKATVTTSAANVSKSFALQVDASTCTAPGYAYSYAGAETGFEGWTGSTPKDGWTVQDNLGNGYTWHFDNPGQEDDGTGGSGQFAIADASYDFGPHDTSLVSPVVDLRGIDDPEIQFDTYYNRYNLSTANVDLSLDGGTTWSTVWDDGNQNAQGHIDIPVKQAAGQAKVRVRFHYVTPEWSWWWQLDNVSIGARTCAPVDGGLVAGTVNDGNNGNRLVGATVAVHGDPSTLGVTAATPADANLADGFYWMFVPDTDAVNGKTAFDVSDGKYTATSGKVAVADNSTTKKVWKLGAGHLTVSSGSVAVTETVGATKSRRVTFGNDGTQPVKVRLVEQPGAFTPTTAGKGAPKISIAGRHYVGSVRNGAAALAKAPSAHSTPAAAAPNVPPWTSIPNLPTGLMDNASVTLNGKVYSIGGVTQTQDLATVYVYDPGTGTWSKAADLPQALAKPSAEVLGGDIYVFGGWDAASNTSAAVYKYDPAANAWSSVAAMPRGLTAPGAAVLEGKLYVVGGCTTGDCSPGSKATYVYDPGADKWSQVADYPVLDSWFACAGIDSSIVCAGGYNPATDAESAATYEYDPLSNTWTREADLPYPNWAMAYAGSGDRLQVAEGVSGGATVNTGEQFDPASDTWAALPNADRALYRQGSACGLYSLGGSSGGFTPVANADELPGYGSCRDTADVTWLSTDTPSFTVAPGASVTVTVSVDASRVDQPGTYAAKLSIGTDSPYAFAPIAVTLTATPPATWGKIAGKVTDSTGGALAGVTVQVCTMYVKQTAACGPQTYTLTTDASGGYQLWLANGFTPLEVIAAKDGYQPVMKLVPVAKGATTTANFSLLKVT